MTILLVVCCISLFTFGVSPFGHFKCQYFEIVVFRCFGYFAVFSLERYFRRQRTDVTKIEERGNIFYLSVALSIICHFGKGETEPRRVRVKRMGYNRIACDVRQPENKLSPLVGIGKCHEVNLTINRPLDIIRMTV